MNENGMEITETMLECPLGGTVTHRVGTTPRRDASAILARIREAEEMSAKLDSVRAPIAPAVAAQTPGDQMNALIKAIVAREQISIGAATIKAMKENPALYDRCTRVSQPNPHISAASDKTLAGIAQSIARRDGVDIGKASSLAMRQNGALYQISAFR